MAHVNAITPIETYAPPVDRRRRNFRHIRVLRWTFRRDDEAVVCELALTGEDREYELRAPADWNPTGLSVERFDDALTAFQRHARSSGRCWMPGGCSTASSPRRSPFINSQP